MKKPNRFPPKNSVILFLIIMLVIGDIKYYRYIQEKAEYKKQWRNDLEDETINGVKNPYMTDELIYQYKAIDDKAREMDYSYDYCIFSVYTLKPNKMNDLITYLNQFNPKELDENLQSNFFYFNDKDGYLITKWLPNSQVDKILFKPLDNLLSKDGRFSQTRYDRFNECKVFVKDKDIFMSQHKNLNFHEYDRYENFNKINLLNILNNPNTLVSIRLWKNSGSGTVYFYDSNSKYFVEMDFKPNF